MEIAKDINLTLTGLFILLKTDEISKFVLRMAENGITQISKLYIFQLGYPKMTSLFSCFLWFFEENS
jgi:hypothetical protein